MLRDRADDAGRAAALLAWIRLARPPEACVVFGATWAGARVAGLGGDAPVLALAASNALLFAASMIFNDWHDWAEDRINKPSRPIASGRVPREAARRLGLLVFALGVAAAWPAGATFVAAALCVTAASVAYTVGLKGVPGLGNLVVALVTTYALACWMLWVAPGPVYVALAVGCGLARLGGEILKTAEDRPGDRACGVRTIATRWGTRAACGLGLAAMTAGLVSGGVPVALGSTDAVYAAALGLSLAITLLSAVHLARSRAGPARVAARAVAGERAVMVLMLVGIAFGVDPPD
ncbi:MAG: UbiA family prenyltransferase [Myxococcota bacterium]